MRDPAELARFCAPTGRADHAAHDLPAAAGTLAPAPDQPVAMTILRIWPGTMRLPTSKSSPSNLMAELRSIVRNTCRVPSAGPEAPTFDIVTTPNAKQRRALELIQQIKP
jgi:hypothetical protein